jgi:amino acid transporter
MEPIVINLKIFLIIMGVAVGIPFILTLIRLFWGGTEERKEPTLQNRISSLTKNLESSVAVITEIEAEISKRKSLAQQLEADIERYKKLEGISKEQVEAIVQILRIPLKKESRRSLILNGIVNVVVAFGFFILGYFIGGR